MLVPIWMSICIASLGEGLCIFTSFNLPDSGLYLLNSFDFYLTYFEWRDTENQRLSPVQQPFSYLSRNAPLHGLAWPSFLWNHCTILSWLQLIMSSFLTLTEGRSMGSCRGLWFLNEQSLLNLQWKSVLPDSKWYDPNLEILDLLPFRIVALAFVTYLQNDSVGDLQFLWER